MRRSAAFVFVSSFFAISSMVLACSSGQADAPATNPGASNPETPETTETETDNKPVEAPLAARAVCATVQTGTKFGQGCSGSGSGKVFCAVADTGSCDVDRCVHDSRNAGAYSFYCTAACDVGDAVGCPSGYECVAQTPECSTASSGAKGLCAKRTGFGCDPKVKVSGSGKFFEGPKGEMFHLEGTYSPSKATLSLRQGSTFKVVSTWDGDASIRSIVRNGDTLLLITGDTEVLVKDGKATTKKKVTESGYYGASFGVAQDGSFVSLSTTSGDSFAALSKRGADGTWNEVGPTRQRVTKITALTKGFLAMCQKTLCGSADGETFTPITLPPSLPSGVTFDEKSLFTAAGASVDDFHFATSGALFHQRKGAWVEEGPKGEAPPASGTSSSTQHPDILRAFTDGTVVFHTWSTKVTTYGAYATYVYGNECWSFSPGGNLENTDLVKSANGNTFVFADTYDEELCTVAAR